MEGWQKRLLDGMQNLGVGLIVAGVIGLAVDKVLESVLVIFCGSYMFFVTILASKFSKEQL
jgi:uncharacterized membrane protein (Fun14 family)